MLDRARHDAEVYQARVFVATHSPAPGTRAKDPASPCFKVGVAETQLQPLSCPIAGAPPGSTTRSQGDSRAKGVLMPGSRTASLGGGRALLAPALSVESGCQPHEAPGATFSGHPRIPFVTLTRLVYYTRSGLAIPVLSALLNARAPALASCIFDLCMACRHIS